MTRRTSTALLAIVAMLAVAAVNPLAVLDAFTAEARAHGHKLAYAPSAEIPTETISEQPCIDGVAAGIFACDGVDLVSFMPSSAFGGLFGANGALGTEDPSGLVSGNSDVWGWTDPETGDEIAIIGHTQGTAFIRITDPANPVYLGSVPNTAAGQLIWHDIKVIDHMAIIVSESVPHGVQTFDMTLLRNIPDSVVAPQPLPPTGFYPLSVSQHNIVVNDETNFAYVVGGSPGTGLVGVSDECDGGLTMLDFNNPAGGILPVPVPAGCWTGDAYIHDAQCVVYPETGAPDSEDHGGKELCATYAEDQISIVDVTDKANPTLVSTAKYNHAYTHQGWFTEDFRYILANDELDEQGGIVSHTRTLLVDTADLDRIRVIQQFVRDGSDGNPATVSIDHNNYTHEGLIYQSNYESGLRVIDSAGLYNASQDGTPARKWDEVAFFDTYPADDEDPGTAFNGTWSNYPYFESGTIVVSGIGEGIFFLRLQDGIESALPPAHSEGQPGGSGQAAAPGNAR